MDWRSMIKDKRFLYAAGAVAVVGGFVWYKNQSSASTTSDTATTSGSATGGTLDTTGTDLASYLSQYGAEQTAALTQFGTSLNDTLKAIQDSGNTNTAVPTGSDKTGGPAKIGNAPVKLTAAQKRNLSGKSLAYVAKFLGFSSVDAFKAANSKVDVNHISNAGSVMATQQAITSNRLGQ